MFKSIKTYIDDTVYEMVHKVTWPTWKELQSSTIIVTVSSLVFSLLIFVMDYILGISSNPTGLWKGLMGYIYSFFIS
ncbi:MAG TPA: preprotein translocase subunit SecE [Crocinitomicaceae bacterium]|nr:preprotein translocase subunit SecE [Crocinitomicaceae bacterium]